MDLLVEHMSWGLALLGFGLDLLVQVLSAFQIRTTHGVEYSQDPSRGIQMLKLLF